MEEETCSSSWSFVLMESGFEPRQSVCGTWAAPHFVVLCLTMKALYHFAKARANVESIIFSVLKEPIIKWRPWSGKYG